MSEVSQIPGSRLVTTAKQGQVKIIEVPNGTKLTKGNGSSKLTYVVTDETAVYDNDRIYVTKRGAEMLREEVKRLATVQRPSFLRG